MTGASITNANGQAEYIFFDFKEKIYIINQCLSPERTDLVDLNRKKI